MRTSRRPRTRTTKRLSCAPAGSPPRWRRWHVRLDITSTANGKTWTDRDSYTIFMDASTPDVWTIVGAFTHSGERKHGLPRVGTARLRRGDRHHPRSSSGPAWHRLGSGRVRRRRLLGAGGLAARYPGPLGEVSERSKERDWKSRTGRKVRRGFKSRPLR